MYGDHQVVMCYGCFQCRPSTAWSVPTNTYTRKTAPQTCSQYHNQPMAIGPVMFWWDCDVCVLPTFCFFSPSLSELDPIQMDAAIRASPSCSRPNPNSTTTRHHPSHNSSLIMGSSLPKPTGQPAGHSIPARTSQPHLDLFPPSLETFSP